MKAWVERQIRNITVWMATLTALGTGSRMAWAGSNLWTAIGPFGGNTRALAVDPQNPGTVYVGTDSGGVFKTTNGGASWSPVNSGLPVGYVAHSLVIDPRRANTVYAGGACGTYGHCGIFKSTNGGTNWSPINSGLENSVIVVESLAIDPQNPDTIYAGATACFQPSGSPGFVEGGENLCYRPGVFKTTNAGASWTGASLGLPWATVTFGFVVALAIDPQNPSTAYAAAPGGVFKTTDGGASWTHSGLSWASALVIDPKTPSTLYAANGVIFKTTDGGANWSATSSGSSMNSWSLAIDPAEPTTVYAAWTYGIQKTTDGGASWITVANPVPNTNPPTPTVGLAADPQTPGTVYAATAGLGVFKSTDRASSWSAMNIGLSATAVYASAVDSQNLGTIYASTNLGFFKTTDGGANWSAPNSGLPPGFHPRSIAIDPQTPTTLYVGSSGMLGPTEDVGQPPAGIFKSVDGGASWIAVSSALEPGYFSASLAIDPHNPSTLYAGGLNPNQAPGFVSEILKSEDGGTSWTAVGSFPSYIRAVVIDSQSPGNLYAVAGGLVFKSTDGGASWGDLRVPVDSVGDCDECLAVGVLAVDPQSPDTLYAGGDVGVLKSTDGGVSWRAMNSGLPWPPKTWTGVGALLIDPHDSNTLYATLDGQVFRSADAAATWSEVNAGLIATSVNGLMVDSKNPGTLYAGTVGGGIFSITFTPVLLSLSGDGQGQGAIQHAGTSRIASAEDPAVAGEYLSVYLTGLTDGGPTPPQLTIGGKMAEVTFFGNVPGYPGLNMMNVRMPSGVTPGPVVPVSLTYLGRLSNQVTIGVR